MYVCVCHAVTDRQIGAAVRNGAKSVKDLKDGLELGTSCGQCLPCAREVLQAALRRESGQADGAQSGALVPAFG